ncbi:MAG: polysaccharide deacetylase family protein [Bacteroidia bacterium]|nr:polysaccharide deacetylase family protein [Bacteroidia bacterium]
MSKPIASLSLDLDDQWTYMKTHGDPGWESYPSYHSYAVPRILDFLDAHNTKITFFIVAQDAAFDHNKEVLAEISQRGHDIGNHTFHHDPWLHIYSEKEINDELALAEEHIQRVTGVRPVGFRGPGFSFSKNVLRVLAKRGYKYDASTLPNILNPLARAYFLSTSKLSKEEREQRKGLFGTWKDGFRPLKPYKWTFDNMQLTEIPVTTMPVFKVPIHASYVLYLSTFNYHLGIAFFRFAIAMCKLTGTAPSILLHPLDFIGYDDTPDLAFFPAMRVNSDLKLRVMHEMFRILGKNYDLRTMQGHYDSISEKKNIKTLEVATA